MEKTVRMSPVSRREFGRSVGLGLLAGASACLFPSLASADAKLLDEAIKKAVYRILPDDGSLCFLKYRLRQIEKEKLDKNPRLFFPIGEI